MKYVAMLFGDQASMMELKTTEWISEMIVFMERVNAELAASGELVVAEGLANASQAKLIAFKDGVPVATDGPFAESKESLAGYWILSVESEARAVEFPKKIVAFTEAGMGP